VDPAQTVGVAWIRCPKLDEPAEATEEASLDFGAVDQQTGPLMLARCSEHEDA